MFVVYSIMVRRNLEIKKDDNFELKILFLSSVDQIKHILLVFTYFWSSKFNPGPK